MLCESIHALLAADGRYRLDHPDKPLKSNYTETFGLRLEELLEDFAFADSARG